MLTTGFKDTCGIRYTMMLQHGQVRLYNVICFLQPGSQVGLLVLFQTLEDSCMRKPSCWWLERTERMEKNVDATGGFGCSGLGGHEGMK